jgi:hypothetical protein
VLLVAGMTVAVAGGIWLLFSGLIARTGMRVGRLLRLVPPLPPAGSGNPPLEIVVADLRRIRRELESPPPGLPMAKRRGTLLAYDDRLIDACRALEVPNALEGLAEGLDRDAERLRAEWLLEKAGVAVPPRRSA